MAMLIEVSVFFQDCKLPINTFLQSVSLKQGFTVCNQQIILKVQLEWVSSKQAKGEQIHVVSKQH